MNELKPEAFLVNRLAGNGYGDPRAVIDATRYDPRKESFWLCKEAQDSHEVIPLVAIPDTHRVVSVELLRKIEMFADGAQSHYSAMNDEVCQSYSEPWQQALIIMGLVGDIIDNKEQKE